MTAELIVLIDEPAADAEGMGQLSQALREELLGLDVNTVMPMPAGTAPPGSRGIDVTSAGALLVSLNASVELVSSLVLAVRSWIGRSASSGRSVELTVGDSSIRLSDASTAQQDRLIDEFIRSVGEEHSP